MGVTMKPPDTEERQGPRRRSGAPAALPDGAAPLFVAGGLWAAIAMAMWLLALGGAIEIPGPLTPLDWHVHELLYGFVPAIAVGYMMTMVANWSGHLPVHGTPRALLLALWLAGRLALLSAPPNGFALAAVIDVAFLLVAWVLVAREAIVGRDRRAVRLLSPLAVLLVGNAFFHWQAIEEVSPATGMPTRLGVAAAVMLISLVGGLLVPSFTRRWLLDNGRPTLARPLPLLETATNWGSAVALLAWAVTPAHPGSGVLLVGAGLLQLARWLQWRPWRTLREPLVLALQVGYGFLPAGFLMLGFGALAPDFGWPRHGDAVHAWTAGAVGTCMLSMMIRVALRRARLPAHADVATTTMLGAVMGAGLLRSIGGLDYEFAVGLAAGGWIAAFAGYVLVFGPMLSAPPPARRAD